MGRFEDAKESAATGIDYCTQVKEEKQEAATLKTLDYGRRDLLNILTRAEAKLTGRAVGEVRAETAKAHHVDNTFCKTFVKQQEQLEKLTASLRKSESERAQQQS